MVKVLSNISKSFEHSRPRASYLHHAIFLWAQQVQLTRRVVCLQRDAIPLPCSTPLALLLAIPTIFFFSLTSNTIRRQLSEQIIFLAPRHLKFPPFLVPPQNDVTVAPCTNLYLLVIEKTHHPHRFHLHGGSECERDYHLPF